MEREEEISYLIQELLKEMPQYEAEAASYPKDERNQRRLLRSLMNVRPPLPLSSSFLKVQDALLQQETAEKKIVTLADLKPTKFQNIYIWQGDITRLGTDAVVNAANAQMLGCFVPCHGCIDNAIHSAAGLQLRDACNAIMQQQGHEEPIGCAKITPGYNLPAKFVIHTVGPYIYDIVHEKEKKELYECYFSCLELAQKEHLESIAFCCISTGEYHFPNALAATIAVQAVRDFQNRTNSEMKVIFNVFKDIDKRIYQAILTEN